MDLRSKYVLLGQQIKGCSDIGFLIFYFQWTTVQRAMYESQWKRAMMDSRLLQT